jgi:hypothetical protein
MTPCDADLAKNDMRDYSADDGVRRKDRRGLLR